MLDDEALQELAADIKENGLLVPVVLDRDGVLIDGRNRLAACRIAGVKAEFQTFDGDDIEAFVISSNINRRHLTKGQMAIAVARLYPHAEARGRGKKSILKIDFEREYLNKARKVLRFAPDLADAVMAPGGAFSLIQAYQEATGREQAANSIEGRAATLRSAAPDLAERVSSDGLTFEEAWGAYLGRLKAEQEREETRRTQRANATIGLCKALALLTPTGAEKDEARIARWASEWMADVDPALWPSSQPPAVDRV